MIKTLFLSLFMLVLIIGLITPVFAQNEGGNGQNSLFSIVLKGFFGLYRGSFDLLRLGAAIGQNIWDFKLKPYLGKASGGFGGKDVQNQVPGIEKEFNREVNNLKTEIPEAIRIIWQKWGEIMNKISQK